MTVIPLQLQAAVWSQRIQDVLNTSQFRRTVSTGCDYYDHKDEADLEFTVDQFNVYAMPEAMDWLISEAAKH
jgi:hypothetical protein